MAKNWSRCSEAEEPVGSPSGVEDRPWPSAERDGAPHGASYGQAGMMKLSLLLALLEHLSEMISRFTHLKDAYVCELEIPKPRDV